MCQVSCGQFEFGDRCSEAGIDFIEGLFEASRGSAVAWQGCGKTWAKKTIVGSGEEQSGAETGLGDVVAVGVWPAFDHAVEAQTAELIGHRTRPECCGVAAAEIGQVVTQIGPAKADWQQAEKDQGMP
jgi:hypothetical protein